jgi:hypothetical protein
MKRMTLLVLAFSLVVFCIVPSVKAADRSFDDIFNNYEQRSTWDKQAKELENELASIADGISGYDLWKTLWSDNISSEKRAANALKLAYELFPGSDLRRWEDIEGFWYPGIIPKPLASIDAVYVAASKLVTIDKPGAAWLARNMLNDISRSSRTRYHFMKTAPEEYAYIIEVLENKGMKPVIGSWTVPDIKGKLPLAGPVRGERGLEWALMHRNLSFLNASGQISSRGRYAWDRVNGRLYRIIDRNRNGRNKIIYFP